MDFLSGVPNILQNAAILTLVVAFLGYALTFVSAHMLAQRRDKLELVNKRLNEFYGPLYVASEAGNIAYRGGLQGRAFKVGGRRLRRAALDDWLAAGV